MPADTTAGLKFLKNIYFYFLEISLLYNVAILAPITKTSKIGIYLN